MNGYWVWVTDCEVIGNLTLDDLFAAGLRFTRKGNIVRDKRYRLLNDFLTLYAEEQFQPLIPGVTTNGHNDSGVREGKSGFSVRKDRGLRRANAKGGGLPAEEARRAWYVDDDGDEEGREV